MKRQFEGYGRAALFLVGLLFCQTAFTDEVAYPLDKAPIDPTDQVSLQRGAQLYMNHCAGCHSLKYLRYNGMAKDIGITDRNGQVLEQALKDNLVFSGDKTSDAILSGMTKKDAANWFGVPPPDLSLVARSKGVNWLYTYLRTFYLDDKRPWGVNNRVFPDVAMPHVLYDLQNRLSPQEYDTVVMDLVNFLSYAGEPIQNTRKRIGVWVLLFLGICLVFAILLKREYWKDVR
jgi:ubiquinol-cytochrome c reductase cytochrome c1 subunit